MARQGKKFRDAAAKVERRPYPVDEAVKLVRESAFARFDETVEVAMRLGVDPKYADQMVRGTVVLPHGLGKSKRVLAIAGGEKQKVALAGVLAMRPRILIASAPEQSPANQPLRTLDARQSHHLVRVLRLAATGAIRDTAMEYDDVGFFLAEFLLRSYALNRAGMAQLAAGLAGLKIETVPSKGNFLLARVGDAARINAELLKRGVIVRPVANYGLPEFLRVSVGLASQNARFLDALSACL
mgnify:CR=1 FL=1